MQGARVTVRLNTLSANKGFDSLKKVAINRALRRTSTTVRAYMAREVGSDLGLRIGRVKDEIKIAVDDLHLDATLTITGRRIPLIEFKARGPEPSRGKGTGVSYRIGANSGRIRRGFIATMRTGHRGVFERADKAGRPLLPRLPIQEKFGPSLPHVFGKKTPAGLKFGAEVLLKNLEREFSFALSQMKG